MKLTCICDLYDWTIERWKNDFPDITGYKDYDEMLEKGDFDAVFIATPIKLHYEQTMKALKAGKHVLCEVYAADTIEQLENIVQAVEESGKIYMMAENYCYIRENMMVQNMVDWGKFGEITYAEGMYIHDCRPLRINGEGGLTWRGEQIKNERGNTYPTHSLGPVAKWMGITDTDRMVRSSTFSSQNASMRNYVRSKFGDEHEATDKNFWAYGDSTITTIECESGALIVLRFDGDSLRPHQMAWYTLQGTGASYISPRQHGSHHFRGDVPLIWMDGYSKKNADDTADIWDDLWSYMWTWEHPLWKENMAAAEKCGHGGGDFFVLKEFADAIIEKRRPYIDVYDAAAWSSIVNVSLNSIKNGCVPIDVPQFKRNDNIYK